jgi:hypothetical protein
MTFTYNISATVATTLLVAKVRLEIGDSSLGAGVRPDRTNFTDEEIAIWLAETSNDYHLAAARAFEVLAGVWASAAHTTSRPQADSFMGVSENYRKQAAQLRSQFGGDSIDYKATDTDDLPYHEARFGDWFDEVDT